MHMVYQSEKRHSCHACQTLQAQWLHKGFVTVERNSLNLGIKYPPYMIVHKPNVKGHLELLRLKQFTELEVVFT